MRPPPLKARRSRRERYGIRQTGQSCKNSGRQGGSGARARRNQAAERAEDAATTAEACAAKLETGLAEQQRIAEMATQITRLADG